VLGPVQVVVLGIDHPTYTGDVLAELISLREAGVVRLLDLMVVSRVDDETFETLPAPRPLPEDLGQLAAGLLGLSSAPHAEADTRGAGAATDSAWSLADAVPVGSTAVVAVMEHIWAAPLRDAIRRAGGVPLDETWLAPQDVELVEELMGQSER
jgi:hypothetical protein